MKNSFKLIFTLFAFFFVSVSGNATTTTHTTISRLGEAITHHEETGSANTELAVSTPTDSNRFYARSLVSVYVSCSGSTTVAVAQVLTRILDSGSKSILLPDISLTATTSGFMLSNIDILPSDVLTVTVPAAGAGITCSVAISEERK